MMENKKPINTMEMAGTNPKNDSPRTTLDLHKFKKDISTRAGIGQESPSISWKEIKALKKSNYHKIKNQFNKAFVLKHKREGVIAEVRASSVIQACKFIGWRPRQVELLETVNQNTKDNPVKV